MSKILVYVPMNPTTPKIYGRTIMSILRMKWDEPFDIVFGRHDRDRPPGSYKEHCEDVAVKYNRARELALAGGYDAMLTIEADMIVPMLTLERLTRVEADVAYGLYVSRHGKHQWLAFSFLNKKRGISMWEDEDYGPEFCKEAWGKVVETMGVGHGCTLIWRHVLEKIPFRFTKGRSYGADWHFSVDLIWNEFMQAHDLGVVCGHIDGGPQPVIYWPDPDALGGYTLELMDPEQFKAIPKEDSVTVYVNAVNESASVIQLRED